MLSSSLFNIAVRKYGSEPIFNSLNDLLSSSKPDDAISEPLAELLGFEELEIVTEVLRDRPKVAQEVRYEPAHDR